MSIGSIRAIWPIVFALLLSVESLSAQTVVNGPVTTNHAAVWDQTDVATSAAAAALIPRFRIDGQGPLTATGTTCVAFVPTTANKWTCSVKLSAAMVAVLNLTGSHSMVLRMFDSTTDKEGTDSVPFVLMSPPAAPSGLRITASVQPSDSALNSARRTTPTWLRNTVQQVSLSSGPACNSARQRQPVLATGMSSPCAKESRNDSLWRHSRPTRTDQQHAFTARHSIA